jgi:hypothetical protein
MKILKNGIFCIFLKFRNTQTSFIELSIEACTLLLGEIEPSSTHAVSSTRPDPAFALANYAKGAEISAPVPLGPNGSQII